MTIYINILFSLFFLLVSTLTGLLPATFGVCVSLIFALLATFKDDLKFAGGAMMLIDGAFLAFRIITSGVI